LSDQGHQSSALTKIDSSEAVKKNHIPFIVALIGMIGVALTGAISFKVYSKDLEIRTEFISNQLSGLAASVENQFYADLTALRALQAYARALDAEPDEAFLKIGEALKEPLVGSMAYGWAPKVIGDLNSEFEQVNSIRTGNNQSVLQLDTEGNVSSASPSSEYLPILLLTSDENRVSLKGVDLRQIADAVRSVQYAIDADEISFSAPLLLKLDRSESRTVIGFAPVYQENSDVNTVEQRRKNVKGIVFGLFDPTRIVVQSVADGLLSSLLQRSGNGLLVDWAEDRAQSMPIYQSPNFQMPMIATDDAILARQIVEIRTLLLGTQQLRFTLVSALPWGGFTLATAVVLIVGFSLTTVLAAYTSTLVNRARKVNALVDARTLELAQSESRIRDMADVAADWFWSTDAAHRFNYFSDRLLEVTGFDPANYLGVSRRDLAASADTTDVEMLQNHFKTLDNQEPFEDFRYTLRRGDGERVYLSISGKPTYAEDGTFLGYNGSGRNVTEEEKTKQVLQKNEEQLRRYIEELEVSQQYLEKNTSEMTRLAEQYAVEKERAEASEKSKSEFLASMSHEIRTPMTGVMGFADMLLDGDLDDQDREKVLKIKGATQSLLTIINDILDLSKLEAGRLEVEKIDYSFPDAIEDAVELVRERARAKGLAIEMDLSPQIPVGLKGDPTRLRQVLINLIGNAVKFTHEGSIKISANFVAEEDSEAIKIAVQDTGIGLSASAREHLFQDFHQADASISRRYEGTGLGLAISRRLTELMGGRIGVDSHEGMGSTFWFILPFEKATSDVRRAASALAPTEFETKRALKVLVAEDNKLNQRIIEATMQKFGHRVTIVENGARVLEAISQDTFDLILMDIRMPEMSGPDATRAIRAQSGPIAEIPIIALTADAMEEHVRGYLEVGMNACATKPIDRAKLLLTINDVLGEEIHHPIKGETVSAGSKRKRRSDDAAHASETTIDPGLTAFLQDLKNVAEKIDDIQKENS
jgi:PAS domain S-box-containing protein